MAVLPKQKDADGKKKSRSRSEGRSHKDADALVPTASENDEETGDKNDNETEIDGGGDKQSPPSPSSSRVVYLGGIVYGFFEHQIRAFFSQFGPIERVRLSRNKKTGRSKHYAFVEFADAATAAIVARTMDGYLLMGNILRCRLVPADAAAARPDLWKGANRRFKTVPWSRIAGRALARPATESAWDRRRTKEEARRKRRAEKLKELGYEFEGPDLKVAEAPAAPELEGPEKEEEEESVPKAIEAGPPVSKKVKAKK